MTQKPPWTGSTSCAPPSPPPTRRPRRGHRLQEPQIRRAGLPLDQSRRPGPATVFHGWKNAYGRVPLHAGLLPHLAPPPGVGAIDLHRREPAPAGQPSRARPPLGGCPGQGLLPARRSRRPCRSFRGLLAHLATLPRNQVRFAGATADVPMLTEPTSTQREAFDLIGVPIPLLLK